METKPIEIFSKWFSEELNLTKVSIPSACCLSTIGIDNYPNARFVALKGIVNDNFIVTGTLTSRKGLEINETNKVALTFWWTETERQVRIQGNAIELNKNLADKYFSKRNRDSQIVSIVSNQGQTLKDIEILNSKYREIEIKSSNQLLTRPENWGGYEIEPIRIEFLEFKTTRFHDRKLYEIKNGRWEETVLQP
ncbi:pyridoxine/pyridoxamine 5'-phosphate oxidase [Flavobacterium soyangense]|uniref:Pyridoxal 5'-phosphate synthase n=1 Tax=Flavobacterium soyangense TaxID=2023265 RepID=A0A930UCP7_9FLAO|nr:pyridoxal 5'-phosphate synthase [Flavobacterium soyangense]MBF2709777.1 pyridoxal 5'-phosphate synthase [Flavobacterium soyangense]